MAKVRHAAKRWGRIEEPHPTGKFVWIAEFCDHNQTCGEGTISFHTSEEAAYRGAAHIIRQLLHKIEPPEVRATIEDALESGDLKGAMNLFSENLYGYFSFNIFRSELFS